MKRSGSGLPRRRTRAARGSAWRGRAPPGPLEGVLHQMPLLAWVRADIALLSPSCWTLAGRAAPSWSKVSHRSPLSTVPKPADHGHATQVTLDKRLDGPRFSPAAYIKPSFAKPDLAQNYISSPEHQNGHSRSDRQRQPSIDAAGVPPPQQKGQRGGVIENNLRTKI